MAPACGIKPPESAFVGSSVSGERRGAAPVLPGQGAAGRPACPPHGAGAVRRGPAWRSLAVLLALGVPLAGCNTASSVKDFFLGGPAAPASRQALTGFIGGVAADEPQAALVARQVLARGGTAADAAVALGLTLAVTLPSRASLGAGGACLAYSPPTDGPGGGAPEAILFPPLAPVAPGAAADRPAAVPMLARGLYLLSARYGTQPFETLVSNAEQLARFGVTVSRALATDLAQVSGPLLADPNARGVFGTRAGTTLAEGATLVQPELGGSLAQIRTAGVGDLYQGVLARRLVEAGRVAGAGLSLSDLRDALPHTATPIVVPAGRDRAAFLPPPADGGLAAAAAFQVLEPNPAATDRAGARAQGAAARFRAGGVTAAQVLAGADAGSLPLLPASTSFVVIDRRGNAVSCALSMDNLFGTGRIAPGTGIVLAASPAAGRLPLLAAGIVWNANINAFRATAAGSGQEGAALAVATSLADALHGRSAMPRPVPEPGRANAIACPAYLPGESGSCNWAADPRGSGLAVGSD